jgi:hypothetical protein
MVLQLPETPHLRFASALEDNRMCRGHSVNAAKNSVISQNVLEREKIIDSL